LRSTGGPDSPGAFERVANNGKGEWIAVTGDLHRGDYQSAFGISGLFLAIQVAQEQFAGWSHRSDALGSMFEYNLIPFPPTLQNRVGSISANFAGRAEACERGKETRIIN
jgi:hypothetical protein